MKSIKLVVAVLAVLVMIPASSYALVDFGAYGGYSYANLDTGGTQENIKGWEYGAFGHLNTGLPMLFTIGLGGFYQVTNSTLEVNSEDVDVTRTMYGLDAIFILELPLLPVNPFLRGGLAINEELEIGEGDPTEEKFKSYYVALGVGYSIFPMTKIFAEYVFNYSKQEDDSKVNSNAIHVGLMINIGL
ncbi:MAG TPA: outer membrane beta-barrel protein [Spirochaetota bacterium]|nr:outer membrane beta-barrel protein [Spirochaetota bacterium]